MGIIRSAITLVAAGIAANMVLKARREGRSGRLEGSVGSPSLTHGAAADAPHAADRLAATGEGARSTRLPGQAHDS
ncbi:MAG: hypothetical protein ABIO71_02830 [Caldimonas sp.]